MTDARRGGRDDSGGGWMRNREYGRIGRVVTILVRERGLLQDDNWVRRWNALIL